jgi:hypothetical protein
MNSRHFPLATLLLPAALALGGCGNKGELVRPGVAPHAHHVAPVSAPAPTATSAMPGRPPVAATASPRG